MKTAIYVRVSTLEQAEEGYSIDEQINKLQKYCEIKNWTVISIYKDGGFSGSNIDRPGLSRLVTDARRKKFDCVLVYKLDRLSRSQKDTLFLIEDVFTTNDIAFVSLNENFDTSSAFGKAMIGILAVFAQLEREQIKERMTMGKVGRAKAGKSMSWARIPFGYTYENDTYIKHPIQAPIVKQIFEDYLHGLSITKLRQKLNKEGHIGKDIEWSYRTLRQILDNPVFAGFNRFNDQLFEGNHESIISKEIFDKVQEQLKIRQIAAYQKSNNPRPFQAKYMLSGLIRCGICGSSFDVGLYKKRKDGTRHRYYRCYSRTSRNHNATMKRKESCSSPNYSLEQLEQNVLMEIEKLRLNPNSITQLSISENEIDQSSYLDRIDDLDLSLEKIVDLYLDDKISKDILEVRREKIEKEKKALENKLKNIKIAKPALSPKEALNTLNQIEKNILEVDYEHQKYVLRNLIEKVIIYPTRLEILWKFTVNH